MPIGRPVANTKIYILDRFMQPVPVGIAGELYIGGVQVGRGYFGRPELTAERFVPDIFSQSQDARLYKTGDLARYLSDGNIEYLGRLDFQVKIRGLRIELGEIEAVLERQPGVGQSITMVYEDNTGDKRLVSYVTSRDGSALSPNDLRESLKVVLPAHMLPSTIIVLEEFPLSPNGKVDRRALPQPQKDQRPARAISAPQTATERLLVDAWSKLLGIDAVSVYDNFFDLGGHSLQAVRLVAKIEEETQHRLEPALVRFQTLRQLAATIDVATGNGQLPAEALPSEAYGDDAVANYEMPLFFGPENELFGMYYQQQIDSTSNLGVVVCPPWGQEYIRSHRACHQLALRLANAGIPAFRFDYYGTGDFAGDDIACTISRGVEDISLAIDQLLALSGLERVVLVGLRLGATLASLAAVGHDKLTRIVLWDPIVNGDDYLDEILEWHRRNLWYYLGDVEQHSSQHDLEVLGFAISDTMRDELEQVNLLTLDWKASETVMLVERQSSAMTDRLRAHLEGVGVDVNYRQIDSPQLWTENPDKALVPHQTLEAIVGWITEQ